MYNASILLILNAQGVFLLVFWELRCAHIYSIKDLYVVTHLQSKAYSVGREGYW